MKYFTIALFIGAISGLRIEESSSDDESEALMLDAIANLNSQNEAKAWSRMGV